MLRNFALVLVMVLVSRGVVAQDEPKGAFARGEKLPGDLAELLDGDESGQVSDAEAKLAIEAFKKEANARQKTERGKMILDALDANKDGKLDDAEAMQGAARGRAETGKQNPMVVHLFKILDANSDGAVSGQEFGKLQALLTALNPEAARNLPEVFQAIDVNQDGVMSAVEAQLASDLLAEQGGGVQGFNGGGRGAAEAPRENAKITAYVNATFAARDRNKDGLISEIEAKRDTNLKREFAADGNGNKKLTPAELYEYLEAKLAGQAQPP